MKQLAAAATVRTASVVPGFQPQVAPRLREEAPESLTFGELASLVWQRRWIAIGCITAGAVLGLLLSWTQAPVYRSKASVEIQIVNDDFLNRRTLDPTTESGAMLVDSYLQTQMKLLQSDALLSRVAEKIELSNHPEFNGSAPGWKAKLASFAGRAAEKKTVSREALLEGIRERLTVRLSGQTRIVEMLFESTDPKLAADFVNILAAEFTNQTLERKLGATQQTADWLKGQLAELRTGLEQAEAKLERYVSQNGLQPRNERGAETFAEQRLRQLQTGLSAAQESRVSEQSRWELARSAKGDRLADSLESDTLKAYRVKMTELRQRLAQENEVFKPAHYKVRQTQAELDEVQQAFERERAAILERIQGQFEAAQRREAMLRKDYDQQAEAVSTQVAKTIHYQTLERELQMHRQLYEATMQRVKEASLASAMRASNILAVDSADVPEEPVKPRKSLFMAGGLGAGAFLGLSLILLTRNRQPAAAPVHDEQWLLSLPQLGALPRVANGGASRVLSNVRTVLLPPADGDANALDHLGRATWRRGDSPIAEGARGIVASLLLSTRLGQRPRVIVLTSSQEGEGKTTVACNLAVAMAETGRQVLLVDADRRNPRLHEVFGVSNDFGLSDLLAADTTNEPIQDTVQPTAVSGLHVLPAGRKRLPALAHNRRAQELLDLFRYEFDFVVIDAPPVLTLADARGLGHHADGVALVVRPDRVSADTVAMAVRRLTEDGIRLLGTIVNGTELRSNMESPWSAAG